MPPVPRRWSNVFGGLLWFVLGFAIITLSQITVAGVFGFLAAREAGGGLDEQAMQRIFLDGDLVGFAFPLALPVVLVLVASAIRRRRRDVADYLALTPVRAAVLLRWGIATLLLMGLSYTVGLATGRPEIPEWLETAYPSVDHGVVFALSIVFFGPLLEEVLYRGYILQTWLESPLNRTAVMVLLSLLWTVTHLQYDIYDLTWVFVLGLLLGYARLATRSLYPPLLMHVLWNCAALAQLQWHFTQTGAAA